MKNSNTTRRQSWITTYRVVTTMLIVALVAMVSFLLARPAPSSDGPTEFRRPSAMEYVPVTDSCVVGGTVVSAEWHAADGSVYSVGGADSTDVSYTSFEFRSDEGREFTVSDNGALYMDPGENLGLELHCDPGTMTTAPTFGLVAVIWGGK